MNNLQIDNPVFDKQISLRECYQLMHEFILQYHERGESSTADMIADIGLCDDGRPSDPAQMYDFVRVAGLFLNDEELLDVVKLYRI